MTVQNFKKLNSKFSSSNSSNKKKKKEKNDSDCGRIYILSNQTKIVCSNWSKDREVLFGEVLESPVRITVMVPKEYVLTELKQNGSNKNN